MEKKAYSQHEFHWANYLVQEPERFENVMVAFAMKVLNTFENFIFFENSSIEKALMGITGNCGKKLKPQK